MISLQFMRAKSTGSFENAQYGRRQCPTYHPSYITSQKLKHGYNTFTHPSGSFLGLYLAEFATQFNSIMGQQQCCIVLKMP